MPIGSGVRRYSPRSSVTVDMLGTCSAGLLSVTVTPGRVAPLSSVTCPRIVAVAWAACAAASAGTKASAARHRSPDTIDDPPRL